MSYCTLASGHPFHGPYHDHEYGFPVSGENALFERLVLEINQAGLSWLTILVKREAFRRAFAGFDVGAVAGFGEADSVRLMADAGIIRNRMKIAAAIENAGRVIQLRHSHGGFHAWLASHHPRDPLEWQKLFKKTFVFTGGEITKSFLLSAGFLEGAHDDDCPVAARIAALHPPWLSA